MSNMNKRGNALIVVMLVLVVGTGIIVSFWRGTEKNLESSKAHSQDNLFKSSSLARFDLMKNALRDFVQVSINNAGTTNNPTYFASVSDWEGVLRTAQTGRTALFNTDSHESLQILPLSNAGTTEAFPKEFSAQMSFTSDDGSYLTIATTLAVTRTRLNDVAYAINQQDPTKPISFSSLREVNGKVFINFRDIQDSNGNVVTEGASTGEVKFMNTQPMQFKELFATNQEDPLTQFKMGTQTFGEASTHTAGSGGFENEPVTFAKGVAKAFSGTGGMMNTVSNRINTMSEQAPANLKFNLQALGAVPPSTPFDHSTYASLQEAEQVVIKLGCNSSGEQKYQVIANVWQTSGGDSPFLDSAVHMPTVVGDEGGLSVDDKELSSGSGGGLTTGTGSTLGGAGGGRLPVASGEGGRAGSVVVTAGGGGPRVAKTYTYTPTTTLTPVVLGEGTLQNGDVIVVSGRPTAVMPLASGSRKASVCANIGVVSNDSMYLKSSIEKTSVATSRNEGNVVLMSKTGRIEIPGTAVALNGQTLDSLSTSGGNGTDQSFKIDAGLVALEGTLKLSESYFSNANSHSTIGALEVNGPLFFKEFPVFSQYDTTNGQIRLGFEATGLNFPKAFLEAGATAVGFDQLENESVLQITEIGAKSMEMHRLEDALLKVRERSRL